MVDSNSTHGKNVTGNAVMPNGGAKDGGGTFPLLVM
jgi:hypothetical protein